jgi:tripartite-type tricarboxylate transporter receptor subunit TctC
LQRVNTEINKLLASKAIADNFSAQSLEAVRMDRAATEAYVAAEARKWGAVVKETGARVD